jgi:ubiquitin carboxyl-terminal hydrolase 9/24
VESNDYYHYILKGVVVHIGYADSGHYYSYIQDRTTMKWHEFNDTVVREFNIDDLSEEAFGGEYGGYETKEKIKNAYMLIYEREKKRNVERELQARPEEVLNNPVHKLVTEEIAAENREHKIQNILFSAEYGRFVNQSL